MPVINIGGDLLSNNLRVGIHHGKKLPAHFGGNFVTYMDQLPETIVVIRMARNVSQSSSKFFPVPLFHFGRCGKGVRIDIDYRCVWAAQLILTLICAGINLFCHLQGFSSCHGQSDYLFKPGCPCSFYMDPFTVFLYQFTHDGIDGKFVTP